MKKKFLTIFLAFVCSIVCAAGCGGNMIENGKNPGSSTNPTKPIDPSDPNKPVDPDDPTPPKPVTSDGDYTVTVIYNNRAFKPGTYNVRVVWQGYDIKTVPLDADGKANAGELEGDYSVYLEGLPNALTYNATSYTATPNDHKLTILLMDTAKPVSGDGGGMYRDQGCYQIRYDGVYRATVKTDVNGFPKEVFYEFEPPKEGWYVIESWANVYSGGIDPVLQIYNGSFAFKWKGELVQGGGVSGSYTKNFRYDFKIDKTEVGGTFSFSVTANQIMDEYPVNVDFELKYFGEYSNANSDIREIRAKEKPEKAEEANGRTFDWADDNKYFDIDKYKLNPKTGYYHRYDLEEYPDGLEDYGPGFGPILMCAISRTVPSYTCGYSLYNANAQGLDGGTNYLKVITKIGEYNDKAGNKLFEPYQEYTREELDNGTGKVYFNVKDATLDFTKFIRTDYYGVCNSEGYCYVTEELRQFLQIYASGYALWTDGAFTEAMKDFGTPEVNGYAAKQQAMWLFACGYYK